MHASVNVGCQGKSGSGKIHEVTLVFFFTFILFLFCVVLSELDIVKVINCFFFLLKSLPF